MNEASGSSILDCDLVRLPKIQNRAGNITPVNSNIDIPFRIKRIYYMYDIPGGEERGGHAHKELHQLVIAASGSFEVLIDDGRQKKTVSLNQPNKGLFIVPGIWRELVNFSSGAICLVLASEVYKEGDYVRDYSSFKELKRDLKTKIDSF